jgi:alkanesulfonate monooxygenase SsuD/methylene tetrahydromethanopterin reductase-like flavin-dependent oxidoreductase (luciferase family)
LKRGTIPPAQINLAQVSKKENGPMAEAFELGVFTFGDLTPDTQTGKTISAEQRMREILAAATLAEASGLDVFAVGEHHRLDMAVSATAVVLAAIAAITQRIRLASAVTILSTADPVTVFQEFATVDLISGGRAEIIAGRGIFTESFPLFGYDLADYDELFAEKLELLIKLNSAERVTWVGRFRPALHDAPIPPRPAQSRLPVWIGTGGTPSSAERAGALGLPLALANISLPPAKLAPRVDLYRQAGRQAGHRAAVPRNIVRSRSRARILTRAPAGTARSLSAARNRSSTRFSMSASCSATSAFSRRSISAACRSPMWRASSSFLRPKLHRPFARDGLERADRLMQRLGPESPGATGSRPNGAWAPRHLTSSYFV